MNDDFDLQVYSDLEWRKIVDILDSVTPPSGLPAWVSEGSSDADVFRGWLVQSGVRTAAELYARDLEYLARHAIAAYDEVEGKKAREMRRRAGILARQLKKIIENPTGLQNYVIAIGVNDKSVLIRSEHIATVLGHIVTVSGDQVSFPHLSPKPSDYFGIKRFLVRSVLDNYRLLTGKVGSYVNGVEGVPHGPLIELALCCVNPIGAQLGQAPLTPEAVASQIRQVRRDLKQWLNRKGDF